MLECTGWAKKLDCFWDHITLQRLMIERLVICQKFQNFVYIMKCIICMSVQLNILCLICINRQYPQKWLKWHWRIEGKSRSLPMAQFNRPHITISVLSLSNNWRTRRPSMPKFGTKVPHLWCDSHTSFKVKRSKVKVTRPINADTSSAITCERQGLRTSNLVYGWRTTTRISHRRHNLQGQRSRSQGHVMSLRLGPMLYLCH